MSKKNKLEGFFDRFFSESSLFREKAFQATFLYRLISLALTSIFFLFTFDQSPPFFKAVTVVALILFSFLVVYLYSIFWNNAAGVGLIILSEVAAIAFLLAFTGGFESIFLWYAFNPLIISSIYLPLIFTWLFAGVFYVSTVIGWAYLNALEISATIFLQRFDLILIFALITLGIQIFGRLFLTFNEQAHRLQEQQEELFFAYDNLAKNHDMLQVLSDFQRKIISVGNVEDIFFKLNETTEFLFPFSKTAVLLLEKPANPKSQMLEGRFKIISKPLADGLFVDQLTLSNIKNSWPQLISSNVIIGGKEENWAAFPLRSLKKNIMAIFICWLKPGHDIKEFMDTLPLFLSFTEQIFQLRFSIKKTEEYIEHMASLYEAAETISSREDIKEVADIFAAYARSLTGCRKAIFWLENSDNQSGDESNRFIYAVKGKKDVFLEEYWHKELLEAWSEIRQNLKPVKKSIKDEAGKNLGQLICVPVASRSRCYGLLAAIHSRDFDSSEDTEDIIRNLSFLAGLSSISIERNATELFADKLLVIEEENRIANEIHDTISQNLFGIVYSTDVLLKQSASLPDDFREKLSKIRDIAAATSKELRLIIYRLSPRHRHDDTFLKEIQNYLMGLANLNDITVDFHASGGEEFLKSAVQKAFYRILKEATANAIKHGNCTHLDVEIEITPFYSNLKIKDNGSGFDVNKYINLDQERGKLGLVNMRELAISVGGNLKIDSTENVGTEIICYVPTSPISKGKVLAR